MAATTNERVTDGPAFWPAAAAVRTKMPAPMTAPIPSAINPGHFRTRLSPPFSSTWASRVERGFVRKRFIFSFETSQRPTRQPSTAAGIESFNFGSFQAWHVFLDRIADPGLKIGEMPVAFRKLAEQF